PHRRRHGRVPRGPRQQLLVEPALDVQGRRRPRRLPGRALLRGERARLPVLARDAGAAHQRPRRAEGPGAGDLDRRGNAAELSREEDVELRPRPLSRGLLVLALLAAALAAFALAAPSSAHAAVVLPNTQTEVPKGYHLTAEQAIAAAERVVKVQKEL